MKTDNKMSQSLLLWVLISSWLPRERRVKERNDGLQKLVQSNKSTGLKKSSFCTTFWAGACLPFFPAVPLVHALLAAKHCFTAFCENDWCFHSILTDDALECVINNTSKPDRNSHVSGKTKYIIQLIFDINKGSRNIIVGNVHSSSLHSRPSSIIIRTWRLQVDNCMTTSRWRFLEVIFKLSFPYSK